MEVQWRARGRCCSWGAGGVLLRSVSILTLPLAVETGVTGRLFCVKKSRALRGPQFESISWGAFGPPPMQSSFARGWAPSDSRDSPAPLLVKPGWPTGLKTGSLPRNYGQFFVTGFWGVFVRPWSCRSLQGAQFWALCRDV